jgi:hypothetical protein
MIEAECTTCGDPGPHEQIEDYGTFGIVVCQGCRHGFVVTLSYPTGEQSA